MNKKRTGSKGFTLIEILIVVVIIGILASLILPRMLATPEKAMAAEANQMLGTMMRGQLANLDTGGVFVTVTDNTTSTTWNKLGMRIPTGALFNYTCSGTTCTATRIGDSNKSATISTTYVWTCGSAYTTMTNGGCTLS